MSGPTPPPPPWQSSGPVGPPPSGDGLWKRVVPAVLGVLVLVAAVVVIVAVLSQRADDAEDADGDGASSGTTSAAGDDDERSEGPPTDASEDEYCDVVLSLDPAFDDLDEDEVDLSGPIADLEDVGTPADIPDDARAGFEAYLDALREADGGTQDEGDDVFDALEEDDEFVAWVEYTESTCDLDGSEGDPDPDETRGPGVGGGIGGEIGGDR